MSCILWLLKLNSINIIRFPTFPKKDYIRWWPDKLQFLRYTGNFDSDASVTVIDPSLYESIHDLYSVSYRWIQSGFKIVRLCSFGKFLIKKHKLALCNVLVHWWIRTLGKCYLTLSLRIHLLRQEFCKRNERTVWKVLWWCIGKRLDCKWIQTQMTLILSLLWNFPRITSSFLSLVLFVGGFWVAMATISKNFCVHCGY